MKCFIILGIGVIGYVTKHTCHEKIGKVTHKDGLRTVCLLILFGESGYIINVFKQYICGLYHLIKGFPTSDIASQIIVLLTDQLVEVVGGQMPYIVIGISPIRYHGRPT